MTMHRHGIVAALALAALLALALAACGPDASAPATGQIGMQVRWAPSAAQATAYRPGDLARTETVPSGVVTMRAIVSGTDMVDVSQDFDIATHPHSGTVNNVPAGSNRSADLQGLDSGGTAIYEGTVTGITVVAGQTADAGTVTLKPAATLTSIQVTPASASIAPSTTQQFTATGVYADSTTIDLTSVVTWASSDTGVATLSSSGLATGVASGTASITASYSAKTGSAQLTVTAASLVSIQVTPATASIAAGTTKQFTATGNYSDASTQDLTSQVSWTSSNTSVATISGSGLASGVASGGPATITATLAGHSGTAELSITPATLVSIQVTPASKSIAAGTTQQYTATGVYTDQSTQDLTSQVLWTSGNTSVATISAAGLASGVAAGGSVTITATKGGVSGTAQLTVNPATLVSIQVTPASPSIAAGTTQPFTATGTFSDSSTQDLTSQVSWSSGNLGVATITSAGLAAGVTSGGPITITASYAGKSGTAQLTVTAATLASIQVTPASASIAAGTTRQFTATGTYSDLSTQDLTSEVTWTSSATTTATVSASGLATGLAAGGPVTITAAFSGKSATAQLTVTAATLTSIQVTPSSASIAAGTTQQFTATGVYSDSSTQDLTSQVSWTSGNTSVAAVTGSGLAQGVSSGGPVTVIASFAGHSGSAQLTVTSATLVSIQVTPSSASIAAGTTEQFTATGTYSNSSTQDLTAQVSWTSSDTSVLLISSTGQASGIAAGGPVTITASYGGKSGTAQLTVTAATLTSIQVTPATASIAAGTTQQFAATGTYSDASTQDLTSQVSWSSNDTTVVTINASGLASGVAAGGPVTITASYGGKSSTAQLTVTAAALSSIDVAPATASIAAGTTQQYTATGTYTDASTQDLTALVSWTSSNTAVATISTAGSATGVSAGGPVTLTASYGGKSSTAQLTVVIASSGGTWAQMASVPDSNQGMMAAQVNGKIYVMGGADTSTVPYPLYSTVREFDPAQDTWTNCGQPAPANGCAPMPVATAWGAAASVNGIVFVLGGYTSSSTAVSAVMAYDPLSNTWSTKHSMPTARHDLAAVAVNGKIYAIDGWAPPSQRLTKVEEYDPATDTWTDCGGACASASVARQAIGATVLNGKIYVFGGTNNTSGVQNAVEEFTPSLNSWTDCGGGCPAQPVGIGNSNAVSVNGRIYTMGGVDNSATYLNIVEEFDPVSKQWTDCGGSCATLIGGRLRAASAVVNGKIYDFGGYDGTQYTSMTAQYSPPALQPENSWVNRATMPTARAGVAVVALNGIVYVIGGDGPSNELDAYDPSTNTWSVKTSMPTARSYPRAAAVSGKIYVIGGNGTSGSLSTVETYDPTTNTWATKASMPTPRRGPAVTVLNGRIYVAGGDNGSFLTVMESYDPVSNTWRSETSMNTARWAPGAAAVNGKMYVFAGYNSSYPTTTEVYDPSTGVWTNLAAFPTPCNDLGFASVGGLVYAIGGYNQNLSNRELSGVEVYNPATNTWGSVSSLPAGRGGLGVATANGVIYAVGGYSSSGSVGDTAAYNP